MAGTHDLRHLFDQGAYSDITIRFSGHEFKGHKNILCKPGGYFEKIFGAGSSFAEANQDVVELKDDDPTALQALFRYIYTFDHNDDKELRSKDWKYHLNYSVVARKYVYEEQAQIGLDLARDIISKIDVPVDIITVMSSLPEYEDHDGTLAQVLEGVIKKNLITLLETEEFRSILLTDLPRLWKLMRDLSEGVAMGGLQEFTVASCSDWRCSTRVIKTAGVNPQCYFHSSTRQLDTGTKGWLNK